MLKLDLTGDFKYKSVFLNSLVTRGAEEKINGLFNSLGQWLSKCSDMAYSKKHILHCYLGYTEEKFYEIPLLRTSLVVQWIRIHLPIQGTWVGSLVQEDPICLKATTIWAPQVLSLRATSTEAACHKY